MCICKRCENQEAVKNGHRRGKQRYKCKSCGLNFVIGDDRIKKETTIKRAFAVILYSLGKSSYGFIAKLFLVTRASVLKWLKKEGSSIEEPKVPSTIKEMEFDEMWHFLGSKKTNSGLSKPWIVLQEELWRGFSAIVMLQHSDASTTRSNT